MKKQTRNIVAILSIAITLSVAAYAKLSSGQMTVKIPFDFAISGKTLPAGEYAVTPSRADVLIMRNQAQPKNSVIFTVNALNYTGTAGKPQFKFHRYGQSYFLAEVWTEGKAMELPTSRAERAARQNIDHLAQNGGQPEVVTIAAGSGE